MTLRSTAAFVATSALVACGTLLSEDLPEAPPPIGAGGTSDGGAVFVGPDGRPIASGSTDPCVATYAPADGDLYVAETAADDGACTAASPCSLEAALTTRKEPTIHLAQGTYRYATLNLTTDRRLVGGWSWDGKTTWTRTCAQGSARLQPFKDGVGIHAEGFKGRAVLAYVDIAPRESPAQPGETRIGLLARGPVEVELDHVNIEAGEGGAGAPGANGAGSTVRVDCTAPSASAPVKDGEPGKAGDGGRVDIFAQGNVVATSPGRSGQTGANGANGTPGGAPAKLVTCEGTPGEDPQCVPAACDALQSPGTHGCGGGGGEPGAGGGSGGSSIGAYVVDGAKVVARAGSIRARGGGAGGAGGLGFGPVPGSDGKVGQSTSVLGCTSASVDCTSFRAPRCGHPLNGGLTTYPGGPPGSRGGSGGKGGDGGGGAGGHSYGYAADAASKVEILGTEVAAGPAGAAGAGGLPPAAPGVSKDALTE